MQLLETATTAASVETRLLLCNEAREHHLNRSARHDDVVVVVSLNVFRAHPDRRPATYATFDC